MNTLCVYCGSSDGLKPDYKANARVLAKTMMSRNIDLVYGGASIGVMGEIADTMLGSGGKVFGVIPEALKKLEVAHNNLTELHVVADMHARKAKMAELSDGFIALPGGFGTLEELFEVLTWSQLGMHEKPVGVLNTDGFYDLLLSFLDLQVEQGFLKTQHRQLVIAEKDSDRLIDRMLEFEHVVTSKL